MTYKLYIGDRSHSSWSMRPWLVLQHFGLSAEIKTVDFRSADVAEQLLEIAPVRTVPAMVFPEGQAIGESLAIAEELATRHPDLALWPTDPAARSLARALACEMVAGFGSLRDECPMNLRAAYTDVEVSAETRADVDRVSEILGAALDSSGGPWLCGDYSIADAFYAPVAARIAGYGLDVPDPVARYVAAHLADPAFRRWRAMGLVQGQHLPWYEKPHKTVPWPGPTPRKATPHESGPSENSTCPYSGLPVTHFMEMDGRVFGFCNAFCRDKTVPDPEAWDQFMEIFES